MESKDLNRLKVVLVEQKRTAKWLSEQIGKDPATVSKWCTNSSQPSLETLSRISDILNVKLSDLVRSKSAVRSNLCGRKRTLRKIFAPFETHINDLFSIFSKDPRTDHLHGLLIRPLWLFSLLILFIRCIKIHAILRSGTVFHHFLYPYAQPCVLKPYR